MAIVHQAKIVPGKLELLQEWVPHQRWAGGVDTSTTPSGTPPGYLDPAMTRAEAADVVASGLLDPDVDAALDDPVLVEVYDGETVVWLVP